MTGIATAALNFTDNMMSCHGLDGCHAPLREHECNWVRGTGAVANQTRSADAIAYHDSAVRIQTGRQVQIAPDWFLGMSAGYEHSNLTTDVSSSASADRYNIGAVLKHQIGPWLFAGALEGGYASVATKRAVGYPTADVTAKSNSSVYHLDGRLRAAYLFEQGAWYFKPMVDFDLLYVNMPSFSESDAGALDLRVNQISDTRFVASPALELGATVPITDKYSYRPFVSLGASWNSKDIWSVSSSFEGGPTGLSFATTTVTPRIYGNVSTGFDVLSVKKKGAVDLRLQYAGQFADHYVNQTGAIKFSVRF